MRENGVEGYGKERVPGLFSDFLMLNIDCRKAVLGQLNMAQDVASVAKSDFEKLSISELWSLELAILNAMSERDLLRRTWAIRSKFKSHVGDAVYSNYVNALSPSLRDENLQSLSGAPLTKDQIEELRCDNVSLSRQMQRMGYYRLLRLHNIYEVKKNIIRVMAAVVLALACSIAGLHYDFETHVRIEASDDGQVQVRVGKDAKLPAGTAGGETQDMATGGNSPAIDENAAGAQRKATDGVPSGIDGILHSNGFYFGIMCIFMGMMGSCMSLMQRTEKATSAPSSFTDTALDSMDVKYSMSNIYIVSLAVSGGVFAIVLYLLSLSDLMNVGDIFPKFATIEKDGEECKGVRALFFCVDLHAKQVAKMLLVSFLAGFAERLVPDTLGSLVEKANQAKKTAAPAQQ